MGIGDWFRTSKASDESQTSQEQDFFQEIYRNASSQTIVINDDLKGYMDAYTHISHVSRCISLIAESIGAAIPYLHNTKTGEDFYDHPALDILGDKPLAPGLDPEEYLDRVERDLIYEGIFGESIWGFPKGTQPGSNPVEAYTLDPRYCEPIKSNAPGRRISGWKYTPPGTGGGTTYGPGEWIHIKRFNPANPYRGLSRIKTLISALASASYSESFTRDFFEQGAHIGGTLSFPKDTVLTEEQQRAIIQKMNQRHVGPGTRGRFLVVSGGATFQLIGDNLRNAAVEIPDQIALKKTGEVFGIPAFFLSSDDTAHYATANTAKASLWDDTLMPRQDWLAKQYTVRLLPFFSDTMDMEYRFDNSKIPALQEKQLARAKQAKELCGVPVLTPDEGRELMDYEPIGGVNEKLHKQAGMYPDDSEALGQPQ